VATSTDGDWATARTGAAGGREALGFGAKPSVIAVVLRITRASFWSGGPWVQFASSGWASSVPSCGALVRFLELLSLRGHQRPATSSSVDETGALLPEGPHSRAGGGGRRAYRRGLDANVARTLSSLRRRMGRFRGGAYVRSTGSATVESAMVNNADGPLALVGLRSGEVFTASAEIYRKGDSRRRNVVGVFLVARSSTGSKRGAGDVDRGVVGAEVGKTDWWRFQSSSRTAESKVLAGVLLHMVKRRGPVDNAR